MPVIFNKGEGLHIWFHCTTVLILSVLCLEKSEGRIHHASQGPGSDDTEVGVITQSHQLKPQTPLVNT